MDDREHNHFPTVVEGQIGDNLVQTVNARDLHAFLKVGKDFSTWIKDRIEQYGFSENSDYVVFDAAPQNGGAGNRGVRREYAVSIDMAKELSMVERNERGKQARQYFLACERKAKAGITADDLLSNPKQLLAIAQGYALQIEDMRRDMAVMKSDVDAYERIAGADDLIGLRVAAKLLQMQERKFTQWLIEKKWAYRQLGTKHLLAYAEKIQAGLVTNKATTYTKQDGSDGVRDTLKFTAKGLTRLAKALNVVIAEGDLLAARNGELAV